MSVKHQLSEICGYLSSTRDVGHSTAVVKGFNMNPIPVAVVADPSHGKSFYGGQNYVALDNLASLAGVRRPLVFDNAAITKLCSDALDKIIELEAETAKLSRQITEINDIINN